MEHIYRTLKPGGNKNYKILCEKFRSPIRTGYVEIDNGVCVLPDQYLKHYKNYEEFAVRDTDVFVASYPKSGTTWTEEMVWMIANNLDFEGAKKNLMIRVLFLEQSSHTNDEVKEFYPKLENPIELLNNTQGPRFIKTHLPWSLLPTQIQTHEKHPKIIYVIRNPKDTCVSAYYFYRTIGYSGTFEELAEIQLAGRIDYGSQWNHISSYWEQSKRNNILFITYEEMITDMPKVIREVANFLDKNLTDEQISTLAKHLSFESIRNNNSVNPDFLLNNFAEGVIGRAAKVSFMRSGKMGAYGSDMSDEIAAKFDEKTKKKFKGTDFPYLDTMLL